MEIAGKVTKIGNVQTFGSGFKKKELIISTQEQYPQTLCIEFVQEKVDLPDSLAIGDDVKISINLRGREWTNPEGVTKYFTSIQGWRIENANASADAGSKNKPSKIDDNFSDLSDSEGDSDLPF